MWQSKGGRSLPGCSLAGRAGESERRRDSSDGRLQAAEMDESRRGESNPTGGGAISTRGGFQVVVVALDPAQARNGIDR